MQIKHMDATEMAEAAALQRENFVHPWSEKDYMEHLQDKDKIYLTAVKDGRVVGSCVLWCSFETADLCTLLWIRLTAGRGLQKHFCIRHFGNVPLKV